jgi:hypothetical protein
VVEATAILFFIKSCVYVRLGERQENLREEPLTFFKVKTPSGHLSLLGNKTKQNPSCFLNFENKARLMLIKTIFCLSELFHMVDIAFLTKF